MTVEPSKEAIEEVTTRSLCITLSRRGLHLKHSQEVFIVEQVLADYHAYLADHPNELRRLTGDVPPWLGRVSVGVFVDVDDATDWTLGIHDFRSGKGFDVDTPLYRIKGEEA